MLPPEGDIGELFGKEGSAGCPPNIYKATAARLPRRRWVREIDFNPKAKKEGNYYVTDAGVLMQREGGVGHAGRGHDAGPGHRQRSCLRDALKQAHYDQLTDGDWESSQRRCRPSTRVHRGARPGEPVRHAHRQGEGRRAGRGRPAHRAARHRRGGAPLLPVAQPAARRPGSLAGGGARARRRRHRQDHAQRLPDGARVAACRPRF